MNRSVYTFVIFSASILSAQGQNDSDRLPVKRVVLYKNGVGYFEHLGAVRNSEDVAVSFTSGQLNDVLKSLTVLDLNGGRIAGVAYGSAAPIEKQMGDLRLPIADKTSLTDFLSALRGARLEVHTATGAISGRLLSVERKTRMGGGATLEVDYLALMTDSGEVKTTELSPAFSVKLLERGLAGKVDRYLDLEGATREADVRRMVITAQGTGERSLFVSYISEVPVWKATYRIVLNGKKQPLLQGWAIVDNTVGQDWDHVELSLVAGAPQSFVQNLSQPYYSRRPVVGMPEMAAIAPQTYEATLMTGSSLIAGTVRDASGAVVPGSDVKVYDSNHQLVGQGRTDSSGRYEIGAPDGPMRVEIEHPGFQRSVIVGANSMTRNDVQLRLGTTAETVEVTASASQVNASSAMVSRNGRNLGSGAGLGGANGGVAAKNLPLMGRSAYDLNQLDQARSRIESSTQAQELGDLFEYKLKEPVTIQKNRSALVPIVQSAIAAEKVSVWNERAGLARPLRALWLNNSSGLTLDGGSFSVLEDETFAGEGLFDPIRPGEKRLVSYASDLALNVNSKSVAERQHVTRARIAHGVLTTSDEMFESKTYIFRNEDANARTVIVEHPVRAGFQLRGDAKPVETTAQWMRFALHVEPKTTASLVVTEAKPIESTYQVNNLTDAEVALFVQQKSIDPKMEAALRKVIAQKAMADALDEQKDAIEKKVSSIFDDQQRLRENMKALKGSAEERTLLQRYTRQLNDQEDQLEKLKKEIVDVTARQEKAQEAAEKMIEDLSFDVKL